MRVLVTGGAGYIGSHTCLELLQAGHRNGRIHNDKDIFELRRASDDAAELVPADFRHDDVRADDLGNEGIQHHHGLKAIFGMLNGTPFSFEKMGEELGDDRIVFYDEYICHKVID